MRARPMLVGGALMGLTGACFRAIAQPARRRSRHTLADVRTCAVCQVRDVLARHHA